MDKYKKNLKKNLNKVTFKLFNGRQVGNSGSPCTFGANTLKNAHCDTAAPNEVVEAAHVSVGQLAKVSELVGTQVHLSSNT